MVLRRVSDWANFVQVIINNSKIYAMQTLTILIALVSNLLAGSQAATSNERLHSTRMEASQAIAAKDAVALEIIVDELQH